MVDALVSNNCLAEAVELVDKWKDRVQMNTIIYSTLIKGYAIAKDSVGALNCFETMKKGGFTPNIVTVNTLLDACHRAGSDVPPATFTSRRAIPRPGAQDRRRCRPLDQNHKRGGRRVDLAGGAKRSRGPRVQRQMDRFLELSNGDWREQRPVIYSPSGD